MYMRWEIIVIPIKNLQKFNNSVEWRFELLVPRNKSTDGESPLIFNNQKGQPNLVKQGVKLLDAFQQWKVTTAELFVI